MEQWTVFYTEAESGHRITCSRSRFSFPLLF